MVERNLPLEVRHEGKFIPEPNSGCWLWIGKRTNGYPSLRPLKQNKQAHRLFYEERHGPIPNGLVIRHKCDNALCVNPDHLFVGTHAENVGDMIARGRRAVGRYPVKLSKEKAQEMRALKLKGATTSFLAAAFGVSPPTVRRATNGRTWNV